MKILFLCNKSPFPPREGGPIAMNNLIEGMVNAGHEVKVLAINSNKYSVKKEEIPEDYQIKTKIEHVYIDLSIKPLDATLNLFSNKSFHAQRFISKELDNKLTSILQKDNYDVVQLETLFMGCYIPCIRKNSNARIILRAHNIEHLIWKRITNSCSNPLKKLYLNHLTKTLANFEKNIIQNVDGIAAITKEDAKFFLKHSQTPTIDISFGLNLIKFNPKIKPSEFPGIFHLGSMNWIPNQEGIKWFLDEVWPLVIKQKPDCIIHLAGREMPKWLLDLNHPNIKVIGEVENAQEFVQSKSICVVPLLSGSGIRIKIIEAMAQGKAVISTSIGAEGINVKNQKNIFIADNAKDFADAIIHLTENQSKCMKLGENARTLIEEDHNSDVIIPKLISFYNNLITQKN
ncbi:MAG: glycosyltransferase family 4 protein [Bacteroidales bacterium]